MANTVGANIGAGKPLVNDHGNGTFSQVVFQDYGATTFKTQSAVSTATEATVWTPGTGKKIRLTGMMIAGDITGNYTFKDNTAGTTILIVPLTANVPFFFTLPGAGILSAAANNVLTCTGPGSSHISGTIFGLEE